MRQYLCVIETDTVESNTTYGGFCQDLPATVNRRSSKEEVIQELQDAMALAIVSLQVDFNRSVPESTSKPEDVDLEGVENYEFIYLSPSPIDEVSLELSKALKNSGLSVAEVARRMKTSRNAVYRLMDPTYHGHSFDSIRRFSAALGVPLHFEIDPDDLVLTT